MSANVNSSVIIALLQSAPAIEAGIIALIAHFRKNNPGVTVQDAVNQFFADLTNDEKDYIAKKAEIAANDAANVDPGGV